MSEAYYERLDEAFKCIHNDLVNPSDSLWKTEASGIGSYRAWKLEIEEGFDADFSSLINAVRMIEELIIKYYNDEERIFVSVAEYRQSCHIYVALSYKRLEDK